MSRSGHTSSLGSVARDGVLSLGGMGLRHLLTLVMVVIVTRGLGPEPSGLFFSSVAIFTMTATIAQLGAHTGLVREIPQALALSRAGDVGPILRVALVPVATAAGIVAVTLWLLAPRLAPLLLGSAEGTAHLRAVAALIPFATLTSVVLAGVRGFGVITSYVVIDHLGVPLARLAAVAIVIALGGSAAAVTTAWALPVVAAASAGGIVLLRHWRAALAAAGDPDRTAPRPGRAFWSFSAPRGVSSALQVVVQWSDVVLVAALASPRDAGIYAAASRAAVVGTAALQATRIAISPQLSGLLAVDDRDGASTLYQTATWWLIAVSWPVYLLAAIFASALLGVFGDAFRVGAPVLAVLAIAMMLHLATGNVTSVLLMAGHSRWNLLNASLALATNLLVNILLIPRFGMLGAAFGWLASISVENVLAAVQVRTFVRIAPFGRGYPVATLAAFVCYGAVGLVVRAALGPELPALAIAATAGTVLYLPLLWRLREPLRLAVLRDALRLRRVRMATT